MLPVSLVMLMALLLVSARVPPAGAAADRPRPRARRCPQCRPSGRRPPPQAACRRRSGPELALQLGGRLLERARVGAGGQVLPPAVADDEADVGPPARRDLLVGDAERGVQDRAGRDTGEDALALDQLPGAVDGVLGPDAEPRVQQ